MDSFIQALAKPEYLIYPDKAYLFTSVGDTTIQTLIASILTHKDNGYRNLMPSKMLLRIKSVKRHLKISTDTESEVLEKLCCKFETNCIIVNNNTPNLHNFNKEWDYIILERNSLEEYGAIIIENPYEWYNKICG